MCGRYALYGPHTRTRSEADYFPGLSQFPGSWNVAPGQNLPITRLAADGSIEQVLARWGLVPFWAKDEKTGYKCINARSETVASAASFRGPYRNRRRCLVPACGFYEWKKHPAGKQPYYITSCDGALLAFAGLWEVWKRPDGAALLSFTILTTDASAPLRPLHDRMPVIIAPEDYGAWLSADDPRELLAPAPEDALQYFPVSSRVNSAKNDAPDLIAPAR